MSAEREELAHLIDEATHADWERLECGDQELDAEAYLAADAVMSHPRWMTPDTVRILASARQDLAFLRAAILGGETLNEQTDQDVLITIGKVAALLASMEQTS
jgi:hypothetical protein